MPILERSILTFALVASAIVAPLARADGIPPPPSCPMGTALRMCHGPAFCEVQACTTDTECGGGMVCREVAYCLNDVYCGGGRRPPDSGGPTGFSAIGATSLCSGTCTDGATCTPQRVCAALGSLPGTTPSTHATYCGCRAAGSGAGAHGVAIGVLSVTLALSWRRVRARR